MTGKTDSTACAQGGVRALLRLEGALLFALATGAYFWLEGGWALFLLLIFTPDLSFVGYLLNPRAGAAIYNGAHTTILPIALIALGTILALPLATSLGLIWAAHIGVDRALGYGLKYASSFGDTHLGQVGGRPA